MDLEAPLGRKQTSSQRDWLAAWGRISASPDHERAARKISEAADRLRAELSGTSLPVVGWSAGKDSLGVELVARSAGIHNTMLVVASPDLEYPAFGEWVAEHSPEGLHIEVRSGLDFVWLADHPEMLFPQDGKTASKWFQLTQHAGQRAYLRRIGGTHLVMGRRTADGNYCGPVRPSGARSYTDRGGFERVCPIWDWSHEDLLNVIAANKVPLPPIYQWPDGFRVGTGPWPARQYTGTRENGWREVAGIDRSVVESAALAGIPGAARALRSPDRTTS